MATMPAEKLDYITPEEFIAFLKTTQAHERWEYWDGAALMSPKPSEQHQEISKKLIRAIRDEDNGCTALQEIDIWICDKTKCVIPDITIKCGGTALPVVLMEILSPATRSHDLFYKLNAYHDSGIQEYWIVDPKSKSVTVHYFLDGTAETYTLGEIVLSKALPWLTIAVDRILR